MTREVGRSATEREVSAEFLGPLKDKKRKLAAGSSLALRLNSRKRQAGFPNNASLQST